MLRFAVIVVGVLVASVASAQRLEQTLDLAGLGWGRLEAPIPIDTDGNPDTQEWAVYRKVVAGLFNPAVVTEWRVVAIRDNQLCVGEWFLPTDMNGADTTIVRIGRVDKLRVSTLSFFSVHPVNIISLDTPTCP